MAKKSKTRKAVSKRVRVTGSGKIKFKGSLRAHKMSQRSPKRLAGYRRSHYISKSDLPAFRRNLLL